MLAKPAPAKDLPSRHKLTWRQAGNAIDLSWFWLSVGILIVAVVYWHCLLILERVLIYINHWHRLFLYH